jgi:hypothetical protein
MSDETRERLRIYLEAVAYEELWRRFLVSIGEDQARYVTDVKARKDQVDEAFSVALIGTPQTVMGVAGTLSKSGSILFEWAEVRQMYLRFLEREPAAGLIRIKQL